MWRNVCMRRRVHALCPRTCSGHELGFDHRRALSSCRLCPTHCLCQPHRQGIANAVSKARRGPLQGVAPATGDVTRQTSPPIAAADPGPTPSTSYPRWLVGGAVPRMRWDDPKLQEYFRSAQPVVITGGCPFTRALVGKWNFAHLRAHFGELEGGDGGGLMMHWAPRHERRFSRFYGERLGRGGCAREKSFARFAAAAEANEASANPAYRFYAQASMLWMSDGSTGLQGGGELRVPARVSPAQRIKHAAVGATLVEEMRSLDWEWLARALSATAD